MTDKLSEKYQGVCRKCACFEFSLHTDSGMWCYWFKDEEHLDCPTHIALSALEEKLKEWNEERIPRLYLIGDLIRADWSGDYFDGRDVRDWIDLVLGGKYEEFDNDVRPYAGSFNLYNEIIKRKDKHTHPSLPQGMTQKYFPEKTSSNEQ
jgi:hypothetical protein